jgi:outer membrane immunogenic protein
MGANVNRNFCALLGSFTLLATVLPVSAADLPVKAPVMREAAALPFSWAGFYIGGHVGYGWGRSTIHDLDDFCLGAGTCPTPSVGYRFNGALGGVQAGYNWQSGNLVIGAEADVSFAGMKHTSTFRPPGPALLTTEVDWFGTGRLRLGYAFGGSMLYATGGVAFVDIENRMQSGNSVAATSGVKWGWTVGGGWEHALASNWIVRAEYLLIEVEKTKAAVPPPATGRFEWDNHVHVARIGLSYRFGAAPLVARY